MTRYARKVDANHGTITDYLERHGVETLDCSAVGRVPDLLCRYRDITAWIELKMPGSAAKWTRPQLRYIADTRFNVGIAKDGESALNALKNRQFITQQGKDAIAGLLLRHPDKKYFTPNEVEAILNI